MTTKSGHFWLVQKCECIFVRYTAKTVRPYTFLARSARKRVPWSGYPDTRPLFVFSRSEKTPWGAKHPRAIPTFGARRVPSVFFAEKHRKRLTPVREFTQKRGRGLGSLTPPYGYPFGPFWGHRVFGLWGRVGFWGQIIFAKTRLQRIYPGLVTKKLHFCTKTEIFELFVTSPRKKIKTLSLVTIF